jgi:hypothetical protein
MLATTIARNHLFDGVNPCDPRKRRSLNQHFSTKRHTVEDTVHKFTVEVMVLRKEGK